MSKAIVTGANRSIGKAIALGLAKQGSDVVISYRSDKQGAQEVVRAIEKTGQKAKAIYAEFNENKNTLAFAEEALAFLGHVDTLVNNAAMLGRDSLFEITPEKFAQILQTNTIAPFYLMQLCAKNMVEHKIKGSIISISSIAATFTFPKGLSYGASKAGLSKLTQNAAFELAPYGIRVNSVSPGVIADGMNADTEKTDPEKWKHHLAAIPLKKAGTPEDVASMVLYLASEKANWITGKDFVVDGGHVL